MSGLKDVELLGSGGLGEAGMDEVWQAREGGGSGQQRGERPFSLISFICQFLILTFPSIF